MPNPQRFLVISLSAAAVLVATSSHAEFPTAVNSQITDSVTQVNTAVLGDAPAVSTGALYIKTSQAIALDDGSTAAVEPQVAVLPEPAQ